MDVLTVVQFDNPVICINTFSSRKNIEYTTLRCTYGRYYTHINSWRDMPDLCHAIHVSCKRDTHSNLWYWRFSSQPDRKNKKMYSGSSEFGTERYTSMMYTSYLRAHKTIRLCIKWKCFIKLHFMSVAPL